MDGSAHLIRQMAKYDQQVLEEIAAEQIRHVDLSEYQEGHPHYEALMESLEIAQRYSWPSTWQENV